MFPMAVSHSLVSCLSHSPNLSLKVVPCLWQNKFLNRNIRELKLKCTILMSANSKNNDCFQTGFQMTPHLSFAGKKTAPP